MKQTSDKYLLSLREREAFSYNVNKAMAEKQMDRKTLADITSMPRSTLGNKIAGFNPLRRYEADVIARGVGMTLEDALAPVPEETTESNPKESALLQALTEKEADLRDKLIDFATVLTKKENPSAPEVSALAALVQAINDMR